MSCACVSGMFGDWDEGFRKPQVPCRRCLHRSNRQTASISFFLPLLSRAEPITTITTPTCPSQKVLGASRACVGGRGGGGLVGKAGVLACRIGVVGQPPRRPAAEEMRAWREREKAHLLPLLGPQQAPCARADALLCHRMAPCASLLSMSMHRHSGQLCWPWREARQQPPPRGKPPHSTLEHSTIIAAI